MLIKHNKSWVIKSKFIFYTRWIECWEIFQFINEAIVDVLLW